MRQTLDFRPVIWVGSSREDLRDFPDNAQDKIGTALQEVQYGFRPASIKTLSGFDGASVLEKKSAMTEPHTALFIPCDLQILSLCFMRFKRNPAREPKQQNKI